MDDFIDEGRRKRRMIGFSIIFVLVVILAVLYFFWGVINRGTVKITGDTPFAVEILGIDPFTCEKSPCEITSRRGVQNIIAKKDNHKTIVTEVSVKLWRSVELPLVFEKLPTLSKIEEIPEALGEVRYGIINDEASHMQKLVESDDKNEIAIVYFQKSLKNPKIFGTKDYVLVIDEEVYKIDTRLKSRERLNVDIPAIDAGKWSLSGKYFVYSEPDSKALWLLNTQHQTIKQLTLATNMLQVAWIYGDSLGFVSKQGFNSGGLSGDGREIIRLLSDDSANSFVFGTYTPSEDVYFLIETFDEIKQTPIKLVPTKNGRTIYFTTGTENFKIET